MLGSGLHAQVPERLDRNGLREFESPFRPDWRLMSNVKTSLPWAGTHRKAPRKVIGGVVEGLPTHVNNAEKKWFPPVFNQTGGSCGASSRIGYMMTYEWNAFHLSDAAIDGNRLPPHFEYPFSYDNLSKDQMAIYVGYPDGAHYGGWDVSSTYGTYETTANDAGWMQGYDNWYNAMLHRITGTGSIPASVLTDAGAQATKWWLFNHNGDTSWPMVTDENGTHPVGGIVGIGVAASSAMKAVPETDNNRANRLAGKMYLEHWGEQVNHAQTIVGYDDRIEFDLDGNGVYGEEHNALGQDECGAWIAVNSWGTGWGNGGFAYVPYALATPTSKSQTLNGKTVYVSNGDGFWPEVYYLRQNYTPTRTMKVKMSFSKRSEISVSVGAAQNIEATSPEVTSIFRYINYTGDGDGDGVDAETPLLGRWADGKMHTEAMEYGIDLTDLSAGLDLSKPVKYFLIITPKAGATGTGTLNSASVLDYQYNLNGVETPFADKDITIENKGTKTIISVVVNGEAYNEPVNLILNGTTLNWTAPQGTAYVPTAYVVYEDGQELTRTTSTSYSLSAATGVYTVKAVYEVNGHDKLSAASNSVAAPAGAEEVNDGNAMTFINGSFYIPNVAATAHDNATIEFWMKPLQTSITWYDHLFTNGWNGSFLVHATNDGSMSFGWMTGGSRLDIPNMLTADKWVHIAIVIQGHTVTVYKNGMRAGSLTSASYSGLPSYSNGRLYFGSTTDKNLFGTLDEVRVWDCARSADEIAANYKHPIALPSSTEHLLAYLKMDSYEREGVTYIKDWAQGNDAVLVSGTHRPMTVADGITITSKASDLAASIVTPPAVYAGLPAVFGSNAGVAAATFNWTADGATPSASPVKSPTLLFSQPGDYQVNLQVSDVTGAYTATADKTVTVLPTPAPTAEFSLSSEQAKGSDRISFIAHNTVPGCTYKWEMPGADQESATTMNASASYASTGTKTVKLTVTDAQGQTYTATKTFEVVQSAPEPAYNISPKIALKGSQVTLTDLSKYGPTTWSWLLRSSNVYWSSISQHPVFTPEKAGVYDLIYQVGNEKGSSEISVSRALIVCNAESYNGLTFSPNGNEASSSQAKTLTSGAISGITDAWTIDYWFNPQVVEDEANGIYGMDGTNEKFVITSTLSGAAALTLNGTTYRSDKGFYIPNEWHHYAIVCKAGNLTFYRDGVAYGTANCGQTDFSNLLKGVRLGGEAQVSGTFDEFRIWGRALSLADIQTYAVAPLEGDALSEAANSQALKVYYQFNQSSGTVVTDATSLHNDATRANFGPDGDAWTDSKGVFALDFTPVTNETLVGDKLSRMGYSVVGCSDEETVKEQAPASQALDGNESTFWHSDWGNSRVYPHSITIKQTAGDCIQSMALYCARAANYRPSLVSVEQSEDGNTWEVVDRMHPVFNSNRPNIVFGRPLTKPYIRLTFDEGYDNSNLLALNEITFYGIKGSTDFVALMAPYFENTDVVGGISAATAANLQPDYADLQAHPTAEAYANLLGKVSGNLIPLGTGYYRLRSVRSTNYVTVTPDHQLYATDTKEGAQGDAASVFRFAQQADGTFALSARGEYVEELRAFSTAAITGVTPFNMTLTAGSLPLTYELTVNAQTTSNKLFDDQDNGGRLIRKNTQPTTNGTLWYLEPAATLTLPLALNPDKPSESYATAYLPFAFTTPESTIAYYGAGSLTPENVRLAGIDVVPEGTGVLLRNDDGATSVTLNITNEAPEALTDNYLEGFYYDAGNIDLTHLYVFSCQSGSTPGFRQPVSTPLPAFTAFLNTRGEVSGANGFSIVLDSSTTGLSTIEGTEKDFDGPVYDLQGRMVGSSLKTLPRGLYIVKGKKIVK